MDLAKAKNIAFLGGLLLTPFAPSGCSISLESAKTLGFSSLGLLVLGGIALRSWYNNQPEVKRYRRYIKYRTRTLSKVRHFRNAIERGGEESRNAMEELESIAASYGEPLPEILGESHIDFLVRNIFVGLDNLRRQKTLTDKLSDLAEEKKLLERHKRFEESNLLD